jgi:hypothetical protein
MMSLPFDDSNDVNDLLALNPSQDAVSEQGLHLQHLHRLHDASHKIDLLVLVRQQNRPELPIVNLQLVKLQYLRQLHEATPIIQLVNVSPAVKTLLPMPEFRLPATIFTASTASLACLKLLRQMTVHILQNAVVDKRFL